MFAYPCLRFHQQYALTNIIPLLQHYQSQYMTKVHVPYLLFAMKLVSHFCGCPQGKALGRESRTERCETRLRMHELLGHPPLSSPDQ